MVGARTCRNRLRTAAVRLTVLLIAACVVPTGQLCAEEFTQAAVATDHPAASQAGLQVLQQGGNVVDAAVAASFALSVVRPASCGVGGGGFMMIWDAEAGTAVALDYRETAPQAATRIMFADQDRPESASVRGGRAVAVPGTVAGLCFAAEQYGSLPLADLLAPAIRLAEEGVEIDEHDQATQAYVLNLIRRHRGYRRTYEPLIRLYLNNGVAWEPADRFHSPQLPLLRIIASQGAAAFSTGAVAEAIVSTVQNHGGILTAADLRSFAPRVRTPVQGTFRDTTLLSMPPPSSGGIALIQILQTLEQWEQQSQSTLTDAGHNSPAYIHVVSEAMKHAFADRSRYLGDADFVDVPQQLLLSPDHTKQTASAIDLDSVRDTREYGHYFNGDDSGTSHLSIIDRHGNAVACTETINLAFGSFVVVPEYGIILNNEMDDFSARPGEPNAFGLMQSELNSIEPGKRPLSSMTPTIAVRDGRAVLASGASGGPRIISSTLQVVLNELVFGMHPVPAVAAPRFHHQWFPNVLNMEDGFSDPVQRALKERGHRLRSISAAGVNQTVSFDGTVLRAASDPRKHGRPAGY